MAPNVGMRAKTTAIVLTGLPASGKTTQAHRIGQYLGWPVLDKDAFLEGLYETALPETLEQRRRLSVQADDSFIATAQRHSQVVLVSHWRPRPKLSGGPTNTGTPVDWLAHSFATLIEVHCDCSVDTAITRFQTRQRHLGHLDKLRGQGAIAGSIQALVGGYPLGLGPLLSVSTIGAGDDRVLNDLKRLLHNGSA